MKNYEVAMQKEASKKYYYIRNLETMSIEKLPTQYLMHMFRANRSPNTIRRSAFAIGYYLEYSKEQEKSPTSVYILGYEQQYDFFIGFLEWLRMGKHKENMDKKPRNGTCNAYLKDVFRFYLFVEMQYQQFGGLNVLSYNQVTIADAVGVKRTLRSKAFKGYLKAEERNVRAAQTNEIITILEACTNIRDQVLILLISESGYRIGEILGIDYTKDIDYEKRMIRVDFRDDNANDARAKNAEEREGKISEETFEFLQYYIAEYWDILQHQNHLFVNIKGDTKGEPLKADSVYDMFTRMENKTGIQITPHMLRRYFANTRWEADWPLELISKALGHKHLDTTIRYLNVMDNKLKDASRKFYEQNSDIYGIKNFL
ncbi:tyrosine-type recombinase/integrase [Hespellia stercorisuis]|uniref:Phage integrase family protein n=1 Tax=Hespellia stercorisuis DSM 15480 TaxID=1121950 RepID=A0A1M6SFJ5_9FIRM|nr:tyrosine-type recombinase/integrase [Hespellia stercorisuis]SHK43357.1 Phage integrase family protein [Hespellia stercorisuis DSM 15480]